MCAKKGQLGARTPQIVGRDSGDADFSRVPPQHLPDNLFAESLAGNRAAAIHWPKHVS
jgi:hypothetical protein